MGVYRDIKSSRRLVWVGALLGYTVAFGVAVANLTTDGGTLLSALAFLAMLSLPPTIAVLSLDRRPALLTVASMAALIQGVLLLASIGLFQIVPAVLWYLAGQRRPRPARTPPGATWVRPLLALATIIPLLAMLVHLDPLCTVTSADGTVVRTYEYEEAPTGWSLQLGASSSTHTSDGETTSCHTNAMVAWESTLSLALSVLYLVLVIRWWPTAEELSEDPAPSDRRA